MHWDLGVTYPSSEATGFRVMSRYAAKVGESGVGGTRAFQTKSDALWLAARLVSDVRGQGTVEAAVTIPAVMLVLTLLIQPVCLSYTRMVMRGAAGECARAAATAYGGDVTGCKEFALRRLKAVPEVPLFHVGGTGDWSIVVNRSDTHVEVSIQGHARPLPLMGAVAALMRMSDGTGVVLRVSLSVDTRADWVGGDYGTWQKVWG